MPRNAASRQKLVAELKDKEFRDEYVSAHISTGLAHQIRILREQRGWTQTMLAEKVGTRQNVVSRWENPNYGKLTIDTVSKLASAFDVALLVKFVPYSRFLDETADLSSSALEAAGFVDETFEEKVESSNADTTALSFLFRAAISEYNLSSPAIKTGGSDVWIYTATARNVISTVDDSEATYGEQ